MRLPDGSPPRRRLRRAQTLVELLIAAAMVVGVLFSVLALLRRGFLDGGDLAARETADTLSRNLIERFYALPREDIDGILSTGDGDGDDVGHIRDDLLHAIDPRSPEQLLDHGYVRELDSRRLRGFRLGSLRTRVGWRDPSGKRRFLSHGRYSLMPVGMAEGLRAASGFARAEALPEWGTAREWEEVLVDAGPDPDELSRLPPKQRRRRKLRELLAHRARQREYTPPPEGKDVLRFRGDPAKVAEYLGPSGKMAERRMAPELVRLHRAKRRVRRFLRRARVPDLDFVPARVPDGTYRARLEAVDLRADARPRIHGVYELVGEDERRHALVSVLAKGPPPHRNMEGDRVLARRALVDDAGAPWWLSRTDARVYLIAMTPDLAARELVVHTLRVMDFTAEGRAGTHAEVDEVLARRGLQSAETPPPDELLEALGGGPASSAAGSAVGVEDPGLASFLEAPGGVAAPAPRAPRRRCKAGPGGTCEVRTLVVPAALSPRAPLAAPNPYRPDLRTPEPSADPVEEAAARAVSDPVGAVRSLDAVLREDGDHEEARLLRARLLADLDDLGGALADLETLVRDPEVAPEVLRDYAGILLRAWELDAAGDAIDAFERKAPEDPLVWTFRRSLELARATPEGSPLRELPPPRIPR